MKKTWQKFDSAKFFWNVRIRLQALIYRMQEKDVDKYFRRKFSVTHFAPAVELSANLIQATPIYLKLKFLVKKLMELL